LQRNRSDQNNEQHTPSESRPAYTCSCPTPIACSKGVWSTRTTQSFSAFCRATPALACVLSPALASFVSPLLLRVPSAPTVHRGPFDLHIATLT
jgi:hypothetical protein